MSAKDREDARKAISRNIRRLMVERDVTPRDIADSTGYCLSFVYHAMAGKRLPSALTAKRMADAIGVSVDELLEGIE